MAQRPLHALDVVSVERPGVAHAEGLEEHRRLEHLAHAGEGAGHAPRQVVADHRHVAHEALEAGPLLHVARVQPDAGHVLGEPRDGRGVGPTVVVEDDDRLATAVAEVVEALVGHAAGHRAVADHRDDAPPGGLGQRGLREGEAVGVAEDRRGVAVLDPVVLGLGPARVAREPVGLAELVEAVAATREDLVGVGEVAGVPQDHVARRVEDAVQGDGELDDAEVRPEVAAALGDRADHDVADLTGELVELLEREPPQVSGGGDRVEQHQTVTVLPAAPTEGSSRPGVPPRVIQFRRDRGTRTRARRPSPLYGARWSPGSPT